MIENYDSLYLEGVYDMSNLKSGKKYDIFMSQLNSVQIISK